MELVVSEIKRKGFHLLTLVYISLYWYNQRAGKLFLAGLLLLAFIGEMLRLRNQKFNLWILRLLNGVHRPEESRRLSGLLWTLSGSLLTMLIYPHPRIVLVGLLFISLGDSAAALVGIHFGRIKIYDEKTLAGSLSCFLVCWIIALSLLPPTDGRYFLVATLSALFATIVEIIPWPLNDNFWLPILSTGSIYLLYKIFGVL